METKHVLQAGFARVDITPPLGSSLAGHNQYREAEFVLDPLQINALAVSDGERTAILFSVDLLYIRKDFSTKIRRKIAEVTGLPFEALFIAGTHTHYAPSLWPDTLEGQAKEKSIRYLDFLEDRFCDAAILALNDRKPAKMGYAISSVSGVSFIRRFRMKDGSVRTNPARFDPNLVGPVGELDEQVNVLRFVREGGKEIAVANFGVHACCLKLSKGISADFPGAVRRTVEAVLPAHCIFFSGAEGDVNHYNPFKAAMNEDPFVQANDLADAGYNFSDQINANHIGRAIAGALFQVYGDVKWTDDATVRFGLVNCPVTYNKAKPEEIPWAEEFYARMAAGEDVKNTYPPHSLARAYRILHLKDFPETGELPVSAVRIGPAGFVGLPGEPFTQIGVRLKARSGYEITLPCCCTNGAEGYYPMLEDCSSTSYEAVKTNYKPGTAEALVDTGVALLQKLNEN